MRKLNGKTKIFIVLFSIIIIVMIVILVMSVLISQKNGNTVYNVSNNSIIFDSETNLVDTSSGGSIKQRWDGEYYYINVEEISYELGDIPVVYEKSKDKLEIFGSNHMISEDGSITENKKVTEIIDFKKTTFFKLADRQYLIISPEIYTEDKSIFTSKYLMVYIDKKGNASFLNDSINLKTINPLSLKFDVYTFDIANEKLMIDSKSIDLKLINGSTNEYVKKEVDPNDYIDLDLKELAEQYNTLVNSFEQYVNDSTAFIDSANTIFAYTDYSVKDNTQNKVNTGSNALNLTSITKMVSLRGAVAKPTHIDITYSVSDVADQYQVVYLMISGVINGKEKTEKILVDKYTTNHRIAGLSPKHEYTISLGYIERVKDVTGEYILQDQIEDVINVRTIKPELSLKVDKISKGYVYFTFKMKEEYAIESGSIALYGDNGSDYINKLNIDTVQALSEKGFSGKIKMGDYDVFELKLIDAKYKDEDEFVNLDVKHKFKY